MNDSLLEYATLAYKILDENTTYSKNKKIIFSFFEQDNIILHEMDFIDKIEKIKHRLIIIDALYSTNMNKRLFGIDDLAREIIKIATSDEKLQYKINDFIAKEGIQKDIDKLLFKTKYGINKKGEAKGHAISLLSKYFYFLMKYKFPIYDSLVKDFLPKINDKCHCIYNFELKEQELYFKKIIEFNKKSKINNFNKLDNLCWLYGKINKGSFSLILDKNEYMTLIKPINFSDNPKSKIIDSEINEYIKMNIEHFNDDKRNFIEWALK